GGALGALVRRARADEPARDGHSVRVDGVGGADPRRALATFRDPLRGARRSAARDLALPALDVSRAPGDEARAHRPADGARPPPPLPRAAAARARRRRG